MPNEKNKLERTFWTYIFNCNYSFLFKTCCHFTLPSPFILNPWGLGRLGCLLAADWPPGGETKMATISNLTDDRKRDIKEILAAGGHYKDVVKYLKENNPDVTRGISTRSVRRYCKKENLSRFSSKKYEERELKKIVQKASFEVGKSYGGRTLQGYLRSKGVNVSVKKINNIMRETDPTAFQARKNDTLDKTNRKPYFAPYFGRKGHIDQNEKLVRYGVIHVVLRDGCSGFIENYKTLPSKNPIQIYKHLYRPVLTSTGIFDQLRVDEGKEWVLLLFVQELLADYRYNQDRPAHLKSASTENYTIERVWPEVNARVNYPIKNILVDLEEREVIDMTNDAMKYCVSQYTCKIADEGMQRFVQSWNNHRIQGRHGHGIPALKRLETNCLQPLSEHVVPSAEATVSMYECEGGNLTRNFLVGKDLLESSPMLQNRREQIFLNENCVSRIFSNTVNDNPKPFKEGLKNFIKLTYRLEDLCLV